MKKNNKSKIYYWIENNVNVTNLRTLILLVISVIFFLVYLPTHKETPLTDYFDLSILFSFVILFAADSIAALVKWVAQRKLEDSVKINTNAKALVSKYPCEEFVSLNNAGKVDKYPGVTLWERKRGEVWDMDIKDDPDRFYSLPKRIEENLSSVMKIHTASKKYNQINIRVDDLSIDPVKKKLTLYTSRTRFFDSLATNRACDAVLKDNVTIRETYEPGPYLLPLSHSQMSDHIGVNGLIITKDGYIPFVKRNNKVSVGKNTINCSVSASIKTRYAVSGKDHTFTKQGLINGILGEIEDELSIPAELLDGQGVFNDIFVFYRDISECGKPQLSFCYQSKKLTMNDIKKAFYGEEDDKELAEELLVKDGKKLIFIKKEALKSGELVTGNEGCMLRVPEDETETAEYAINMATTIALAYEIDHLRKYY